MIRQRTEPIFSEPFFSFSTYHIVLALAGLIVIAAQWLPRLLSSREPAAAPLLIILGAGAALLLPGLPSVPDPRQDPAIWETFSELCVIVALFGTGMRIDQIGPLSKWGATARLLLIAMPLTIVAALCLGVFLGGITLAAALLLGAVISPTDPVLAADVQVGPPSEGGEHPVRFTLTTEAALNDGLAFPFVYLALLFALQSGGFSDWGADWFWRYVVYKITVGTVIGWLGGVLLGYVLFGVPRGSVLADTGSGVIAVAGVILCYGSTELVEGYGFIAVAVMGLALRRSEKEHRFHAHLHDFAESVEHVLTAALLLALGAALPMLLAELTWQVVVISLVLLMIVRPLAGWIALLGSGQSRTDRAVISIYGVRGIGSIYYLAYASGHADFAQIDTLWAITGLTILISTLIHGFSVGRAMEQVDRGA